MKIEFESVKFRNFLSFGSKWQEVPFKKGVNLVLGYDKDKGKSNGAGKSSFLETVPFALYGQIHRDIRKEQIINWKNRKNCEVHLIFKKNDNVYLIIRGIKPDKFEIYKNNEVIPKPSHVKDYQLILDEIIGMNFNMFMGLIHSNINSSKPILSMNKPEKRKFMEKTFGLSFYTSINELCNTKLRTINEKFDNIKISITKNNESIALSNGRKGELENEIKSQKGSNITLNDYKEEKNTLDDLNKSEKWDESLETLIDDLKSYNEADKHVEWLIGRIDNKIELLRSKIKGDKKLLEGFSNIEYDKTINYKEEIKVIDDVINSLNDDILKLNNSIQKRKGEVSVYKNQLNDLENEDSCPTCGSDIKGTSIVDDLKNKVDEFNYSLKNDTEVLKNKNQEKNSSQIKVNEYKKILSVLEKEKEKEIVIKRVKRRLKALKKLESKNNNIKDKRNDLIKKIESLTEERNNIQDKLNKLNRILGEIDKLNELIKIENKNKEKFKELVDKESKLQNDLEVENESLNKSKIKLNELKDYLSFIKDKCKDEEVKQYAISNTMPYLNKQTNHYLSEVGYNFYIKLDKWLDTEIKGPGITKGSYGSLSGGEGRGIDLALQFSFLDISKLQAGIFPDILIFDELLDSSVDGAGLIELVNIIQKKQIIDDSKVFLISHRTEVEDVAIDNLYYVEKSEGYSTVVIR